MTRQFLVPLLLPADPANPLEAATKQYVDAHASGGGGTTILNGTVPPDVATGAVGDYYEDTAAGVLYGPKSASGWGTAQTMSISNPTVSNNPAQEYGMRIRTTRAGRITGARYRRIASSANTLYLRVWNQTTTAKIGEIGDTRAGQDGQFTATFATPVIVAGNTEYIISVGGVAAGDQIPSSSFQSNVVTNTADLTFLDWRSCSTATNTFPNRSDTQYSASHTEPVYEPNEAWPVTVRITTDPLKADKATTIPVTAPITGGGTLGTPTAIGISDFTTTTRGAVPNPATSSGRFLKDDGTWSLTTTGSSGIGNVFPFMYNTSTAEAGIGTNQIRGNNGTFTASTKLWVSEITVDGLDVSVGLGRIKAGFQVYVQDYTSSARYALFNITADSVDKGAYWELTVAVVSSLGTIPGGKIAFQSLSTAQSSTLFSPTTTAPGLAPGANGAGATAYLNGTGGWTVPAGGGGPYQPLDAELTALAGLTSAANELPFFTGSGTANTTGLTSYSRTLLGQSSIAGWKGNLGITTANEDAEGLVELATNAETITGTATNRATHPAGVAAAIAAAGGGGGTPVGTKLTALTALTGAGAASTDIVEVVDISDTSMAASGTNKKMTLAELVIWTSANFPNASIAGAKLTNDSVTNTQLATMPTLTFKGNATGSTAGPTDLTVYAVQGMLRRPVVANTGTTLAPVVATHENVMVTMSNASAQTITLPSDATSNFPIGAETDYLWLGVGQPAFAAGGGATVNSESSWLKIRARYTAVTAKKIAANTWVLLGALAA